jgi:sporulation protein YlmC with PRC-barrel domain
MALEENKYDHLEELSGSDFEIVDGEPDITGWDVLNSLGQKVGEVDDLLFDPKSRQVRYLVVDLEDNELDIDTDKKVLVPIGVADLYQEGDDEDDLNEDNDIAYETNVDADFRADTGDVNDQEDEGDEDDEVVVLPNITLEQLQALPAYEQGNITPDTEAYIRDIFSGTAAAGLASTIYQRENFYEHDHFDEDKFYNREKLPVTGAEPLGSVDGSATTWEAENNLADRPVDGGVIIVSEEQDTPDNLSENPPRTSDDEYKSDDPKRHNF